jgi:peptide/histidine transporter 3/4
MIRWGVQLTMLRKIGFGFVLAFLSMVAAALVEERRLSLYRSGHVLGPSICYKDNAPPMVELSIFWQIPQFILVGASEVFASVTALELFYTQSPESMRSVCQALNLVTTAFGTPLLCF